ncbi:hypothetical protein ACQKIE_09915 [Luteibacter sp. NPDC031894]|uniref:hypothetical protein n=1 Tax=Luteibacter sp. NPDC031894 TaxID=3390572 RepID=UPI003CFE287E
MAACSTAPRAPEPQVLTRTVLEDRKPADGLLKLCEAPVFKPTLVVGDIQENKIRAEAAYDRCAARMRCLVWWVSTARREAPPAECKAGP